MVAMGFFFALVLGRKGPWGKFFGWFMLFVFGAVGVTHTGEEPDLTTKVIANVWAYSTALFPLWWLARWIAAPRVRF
jgi:hypothetical protein